MIEAAARGDETAVARLLAAGASVAARDAHGRTALLAATQGNHVAVAKRLMEAGADVNAQDAARDSPFLLAGARGHTEIVRLALARNPDFAVVNRYGGTALIPACHYGHVETVKVLLGSRIPVDHVNNLGWTALLEAIILGDGGPAHTEIVRLLVRRGADVNLADREGTTPLAHATRRGYREIAAILTAAGAR
jgi:ankyrin repeat protein